CDTTAALLRRLDAKELSIIVDRDLTAVPASLGGFDAVLKDSRRLVVRYQPSRIRVAQILTAVHDAGLEIVDLSTLEADLEDIFLQLTRADVR
ncbi:MAG TPA: ABC transporter ATP-binding protein, partial [Dongiaceae bacterium]